MADTSLGLGMRMVLGATGGMGAAVCCHPLDVVRVQLQIDGGSGGAKAYKGTGDAVVQIVKRNGVLRGLYPGIDAAFLRQWTYGSCRLGIYAFLLPKRHGNPLALRAGHLVQQESVDAKAARAVGPLTQERSVDTAGQGDQHAGQGGSRAVLEETIDGKHCGGDREFRRDPEREALVRMGADSKLPEAEKRNYKNVVDCCLRIAREEGVAKLWNGATPTIIRATLLSASVLACYSEAKIELYKALPTVFKDKEGVPLMFTATMFASLVANVVSNPFDVVKSRIQNMPVPAVGEKPLYTGMGDCFTKSVKGEGPLVLYKGFTPAFVKLAPYTCISLILVDKMTKLVTGKSAM
eukprot:CAMPEP_0172089180 /NCGR_PEP_ID=MMETSP1043-20130122/23653_1 /TAXON_ID=464988 /ORGANISM="Hemiselmis andersenii, Strain CCMP441" /LENGTH=350 /DNA_ID=CAMNT_0012751581 /DNA_START=2243 /DNA_END=3296 /DNA_ORIENTATION=-